MTLLPLVAAIPAGHSVCAAPEAAYGSWIEMRG